MIKPKIPIKTLELFTVNVEGKKLINEYCEGIKLAIKLVDNEAIITKIKTKLVISKLSSFPIISIGLVSIFSNSVLFLLNIPSTPATIKTARNEKIIKFSNKLKFPFLSSVSFFTYLEKSPKLKITIEK